MKRVLPLFVMLGCWPLGCQPLYDQYTEVATELLLLQVENPLGNDVVAFDGDFATDYVSVQCYLSEAKNLDSVGNTPAEGAVVLLTGANMGTHELIEVGDGLYELDSVQDPDLKYDGYLDYEITVRYAGKERLAGLFLPGEPNYTLPTTHPAGSELMVDLDPTDFDATVSLAFAENGDLLLDERPASLTEMMDLFSGEATGQASIPGAAFPSSPRSQALGVAGIRMSRGDDNFENMDNEVSRVAAGTMTLELIEIL